MFGYDIETIFAVTIISTVLTAILVAPYVIIRLVVRFINRRDDPRHQKPPPDAH